METRRNPFPISYRIVVALVNLPTVKLIMSVVSTAGYINVYKYISSKHIVKIKNITQHN